MAGPTLMQQSRVPVMDVIVRDRLRPVSEAGVASLIASITETGVMKDAIHVRKKKDGRLYLVAGAHRLNAAAQLGWNDIEAKVWTDVTDDWARIMEIDDNLAGAEMNYLDTAVFLAERKAVYERLHPEARHATGATLAAKRWDAADIMSVASFAATTAEKFGMTERHVRRLISAGAALDATQVAQLRDAPQPVKLVDLTELAKIGSAEERRAVVQRFAAGGAKSAAAARKSLAQEEGRLPVPPALDPVEQGAAAMLTLWKRLPAAARRRFVSQAFEALSTMVVDEAERRDGAEIAQVRKGMAAG